MSQEEEEAEGDEGLINARTCCSSCCRAAAAAVVAKVARYAKEEEEEEKEEEKEEEEEEEQEEGNRRVGRFSAPVVTNLSARPLERGSIKKMKKWCAVPLVLVVWLSYLHVKESAARETNAPRLDVCCVFEQRGMIRTYKPVPLPRMYEI